MILPDDWENYLAHEIEKPYFKDIMQYVNEQYEQSVVYPPKEDVFKAFELTPFNHVKVVLLGQDPYHQPQQANGLSFSVTRGVALPPSLRNMSKELSEDVGCSLPHGDLTEWAKQGVMLLNTSLTVRHNEANSHRSIGWQAFTDQVIRIISDKHDHVVFMLLGKQAYQKAALIHSRHTVIHTPHPSPLSAYRGFIGSRVFSQVNLALNEHRQTPINWCLSQ
ncbi:uracil-DNA glycosylase [Alkalibacillus flavidus]|uniref:Uracil-DNA glycosylase n=1 Tax=Alkalibacillus flavidus TaxID=546021 RepID=A0ABV2KSD6_9BACI